VYTAEVVVDGLMVDGTGWFSWTRIHTLEKRNMPEFFNGKTPSKTPQLYMEIRNRIIRIYRENLEKIITVADVQEQCNGVDEKAISRVIEFLDHWGLINYQAPADFLPVWKAPAPALQADVAGMLQALPQKGSSLYNFNKPCAPVPKQSADRKSVDAVISEMLALSEGPEVEYHCNSCATDCSKQRYHCQKQVSFRFPYIVNCGRYIPRNWLQMYLTTSSI
jgi:SWI/SNF related-matrix-associated actin-dependent regulator of chromatin subfamily C